MKELGLCRCSADAEHSQEGKASTWNRQDSAWAVHPQPCRELLLESCKHSLPAVPGEFLGPSVPGAGLLAGPERQKHNKWRLLLHNVIPQLRVNGKHESL